LRGQRRKASRFESGPGHPTVYGRAGSTSTRMLRHFPWRNRKTLSAQRVMWPSKIAAQMSAGRSPRVAWNSVHRPSGTTIWDAIEM